MELFTTESLPGYLRSKGWTGSSENPRVVQLPGGVSCHLFRVETGERNFIVKQALERLEVKVEWLSHPSRIFQEIDCLEWVAKHIDPRTVPKVLGRDDEHFLFLMAIASDGAENWKQCLLRGDVDPGFAEKVGDFLGRLHALTHNDVQIAKRFEDKSRFEELRLDAYLRFTSRKHSDLEPLFTEEIEKLSSARISLVHGDYSPKNFLVLPDGGFWFLDWEVAHYGHPAFDVAFCLNHFLIKSLFLPDCRDSFLEAARLFWAAYRAKSAEAGTLVTFPHLGRLTGMLMLARIDGKSPVEYVTSEDLKQRLRTIAKKMILEPVEEMKQLVERFMA